MRKCTVLEWFVLTTIEHFSGHARYYAKTLPEIAEEVLGLYASGPVLSPVCSLLLKCNAIEIEGDVDYENTELQFFSVTDIGHNILSSGQIDIKV